MTNQYEKLFVIIDENNMQKLKDGRPVYVDSDDCDEPIVIRTEEGYKKLQRFWGENLLDDPINDIIDAS